MSIPNGTDLVNNRVKFKLWAAQKHMNNLKEMRKTENINSSLDARARWEEEIECFLYHLIGAKDALLIRMNVRLRLGLSANDVDLKTLNPILNSFGKKGLLDELNKLASEKGSWFWDLNELRNTGTHKALINLHFAMEIVEGVKPSNNPNYPKLLLLLTRIRL